jgi:hypothetical protein
MQSPLPCATEGDEAFGGRAGEPPVTEGRDARDCVAGERQGDSFPGVPPFGRRAFARPAERLGDADPHASAPESLWPRLQAWSQSDASLL